MLKPDTKIAVYMESALGLTDGKMGYGVLKYSPNHIVAVIDSKQAGKRLKEYVQCERDCPIVGNIDNAKQLGAEALILGISPSGGHIPEPWLADLDQGVKMGLSIVNGLHDRLAPRYPDLPASQWIWDIRQEPSALPIASGKARKLANKRVLFVGSDMGVGKMTAALELYRAAQQANISTRFIATGQIGITISGQGVPLDAIRLDYACGAIENAILQNKEAELILVEGQGAINHPGSTATLPLLRGSCPTHLIFCHRAGQTHLAKIDDVAIPPLTELIHLYEELASACGTYAKPKTIGICLNTAHLDQNAARKAIDTLANEVNLPVWDVVRDGANDLRARIEIANQS